jgi:hypothetical protein
VIFVSHNLDTVRKVCDSAVWINEGQVQATGDPDEVIGRYLQHVARATQPDSSLPKMNGRNWGTGEAVITGVEFLDAKDHTPEFFVTGQHLTARIHYLAHQRVEQPAFGIAIYGPDGSHLTGPNTALNRFDIPAIEGEGYVDYIVDSLPLMNGRYEFTAAIYDYDSINPYHHQHRVYSFNVAPGKQPPAEGQIWIPCRWRHIPSPPQPPEPKR